LLKSDLRAIRVQSCDGQYPGKKAVFETVINATAANTIGLKLDPALLKNADLIID
jgi:hypothetical protein